MFKKAAVALSSILPLVMVLASGSARSEETLVVVTPSLTAVAAYRMAKAAFDFCDNRGYLAAVTVSDRSGLPLVVLRNPLAGFHTLEISAAKARTAASFRGTTTELTAATAAGRPESGIRHATGVIMIGGGIPIEAGGKLVGAIGVSGAPGGAADDECAKAGIAAVQEDLEFAVQ